MALSYQNIADSLNGKFKTKHDVQQAAIEFQNKHGPKGKGGNGKKPYKFGNFAVDDVGDPAKQAKWLIDTGTRNWDSSVGQLQDTIRNNLSDTGPQVPMTFYIRAGGAAKARAEINPITDPITGAITAYEVILHCRN
jgi:hypothetical protein